MTYQRPTANTAQQFVPTPVRVGADAPRLSAAASILEATEAAQALTDGFSRQLTYLRLSITDFCNFRCEYCLPNGYQGVRAKDELTLLEIKRLVNGFALLGTKKVRITGGEPSIRQDVTQIIDIVRQTAGIDTIAMTSNGYKLGKHLASWQAAGLNQLNISMDSFDADIFHQMTGMNTLPALIKDMERLLETTDIKLKINSILMKETAFDNLICALDFVKSRPVTYRFIEFMQTSDNHQLFFAQHANADRVKSYLLERGWQAEIRGQSDGPAVEFSHPDYVGRIGLIAPYAAHFCDNCNRLRVSCHGRVHLCLFDQGNYDIRPFLQHDNPAPLINALQNLMPIKPEHHHLHDQNSGMMTNLSIIGG